MEKEKQFISLIFTALLAMCLFTTTTIKADEPTGMEKCYGVAKAGQNDCSQSPTAGPCTKSVIDSDPNYFIYVPVGLCNRLTGGLTNNSSGTIPIGIGVDLHFSGDTSTTSTAPSTSSTTAVTAVQPSNTSPANNTPSQGLDANYIFPEPKNTP